MFLALIIGIIPRCLVEWVDVMAVWEEVVADIVFRNG